MIGFVYCVLCDAWYTMFLRFPITIIISFIFVSFFLEKDFFAWLIGKVDGLYLKSHVVSIAVIMPVIMITY